MDIEFLNNKVEKGYENIEIILERIKKKKSWKQGLRLLKLAFIYELSKKEKNFFKLFKKYQNIFDKSGLFFLYKNNKYSNLDFDNAKKQFYKDLQEIYNKGGLLELEQFLDKQLYYWDVEILKQQNSQLKNKDYDRNIFGLLELEDEVFTDSFGKKYLKFHFLRSGINQGMKNKISYEESLRMLVKHLYENNIDFDYIKVVSWMMADKHRHQQYGFKDKSVLLKNRPEIWGSSIKLWGQFLDKDENINLERAKFLLKNKYPPYIVTESDVSKSVLFKKFIV